MLVEQLSLAFKCHSSIGNSFDLQTMIKEVLKTFVSETYAIYGEFCLKNQDEVYSKYESFGKINNFDANKYKDLEKDYKVIVLELDLSAIFLVSKNMDIDYSFYESMFNSLIPRLNLSVNACFNVNKLLLSNQLLEKQKEELIIANKTKDDFLANMSHELKTPLNSMIVLSSLMSKNKYENLNEEQLKNINIIKNCGNDLLELINDILDISKIESGKIELEKEDIDLKALVVGVHESLAPLLRSSDIKFFYTFIGKDFVVNSDKTRIRQVLRNFLSNSFKFTREGFIEIKVVSSSKSIKISVIDSGIGIEKSKLSNIFARFKQADESTTRKYGGTGLGLAISKEISFLLGAKIKVKSTLHKGSSFKLILPKKNVTFHNSNTNIISTPKVKEEVVLERVDVKETVFILHSQVKEQFNITVLLKKTKINVKPFSKISDLKKEVAMTEDKTILLLDDRVDYTSEYIDELDDENINIVLLTSSCTLSDKKSDICLEYDASINDIINAIVILDNQNK